MSINIFRKRHPAVEKILTGAKSLKKVLFVAIDYAKSSHKVLFFNGEGDQLRAPYDINNNRAGFELLEHFIKQTCKKRSISLKHVIIGGEGIPCFARNFIYSLVDLDYLVLTIHAKEAKQMRVTEQASTDKLDLIGIGKCMLNGGGNPLGKRRLLQSPYLSTNAIATDNGVFENLFADQPNLQILTRNRARLVVSRTSCSNRIHTLIDQLFPEFLSSKSPLSPFSTASIELMKSADFSAAQIAKRKVSTLTKQLSEWGTHQPEESAETLIEMAKHALPVNPTMRPNLQISLNSQIIHYQGLKNSIAPIDEAIHDSMVSSPGSLLLSIPGIGVVLAAGMYAELGSALTTRSLSELCSYSGIVPRVKQSGGPDKPAKTCKVRKAANLILKNYLVRAAEKMRDLGPTHLREDYRRLKESGQHADFIIARRLLRSFKFMMLYQTIYLPPELRNLATVDATALTTYMEKTREKIRAKWRRAAQAEETMKSNNPLGKWWETLTTAFTHIRQESLTVK